MPYLHKNSHNIKQVANRYGVPLVLYALKTIRQIGPKVRTKAENASKHTCLKKHGSTYIKSPFPVVDLISVKLNGV